MSPFWERARHSDRRGFLLARAQILQAVRAWFAHEGFVETDVGAICVSPGAEVHVAAVAVGGAYLHTSPELAMKKLIAAGETKLFFLGKCYRAGEAGPLHAPEFTMLEWYRAGAPYEQVMEDCLAIARLAATTAGASAFTYKDRHCDPFEPAQRISVRDAFNLHCALPSGKVQGGGAVSRHPHNASSPLILAPLDRSLALADSLSGDEFSAALVRDVEPNLGIGALSLLYEYPIREAALARACAHDANVAERFELYACGVELANGFGELADPIEQRARLEAAMAEKQARYAVRWPIDEDFLAALAHMGAASGCALGFDRLVMLAAGARRIEDVMWTPFP